MTVAVIKAERVVRTSLALLVRDLVLGGLVWRDAAGDFRGAKGDTISIRLPSYFKARKRALRSGDTRTKDSLHERKVDVSLTDDLYGVIPITDEELTLDIENFNEQITVPVTGGLARGIEDELIDEIEGAPYAAEHQIEMDPSGTGPYLAAVEARALLNNARVPMSQRAIIAGSAVESAFLNSEQFIQADKSGSTSTFREAEIGRVAGFPVFPVPGLTPDKAYAFHRTAFVLNSRAPFVPDGVAWGQSLSVGGYAMRVAQQVDPDELVNNFHADVWTGTNHVTDVGEFDVNGKFEPAVDPEESGADDLFIRAVEITLGS